MTTYRTSPLQNIQCRFIELYNKPFRHEFCLPFWTVFIRMAYAHSFADIKRNTKSLNRRLHHEWLLSWKSGYNWKVEIFTWNIITELFDRSSHNDKHVLRRCENFDQFRLIIESISPHTYTLNKLLFEYPRKLSFDVVIYLFLDRLILLIVYAIFLCWITFFHQGFI